MQFQARLIAAPTEKDVEAFELRRTDPPTIRYMVVTKDDVGKPVECRWYEVPVDPAIELAVSELAHLLYSEPTDLPGFVTLTEAEVAKLRPVVESKEDPAKVEDVLIETHPVEEPEAGFELPMP